MTFREERSLEGWEPEIGPDLPVAEVVERAFDYRGNTTVVRTDGTEIHGYVFNRNADVVDPYIQILDAAGAASLTIRYAEIRAIRFTGRDTAAGQSYAAWLRRKEKESAGRAPADGAGQA